jgi:25S rRNA (uracil2634-N3)-methyltransferase
VAKQREANQMRLQQLQQQYEQQQDEGDGHLEDVTRTTAASTTSSTTTSSSRSRSSLPFAFGDTILLLGDGNFTFARALARNKQLFSDAAASSSARSGRLVATSFDSADEVRQKYAVADSILTELSTTFAPFCTVLHDVDARKLATDRRLADLVPNHIVFNFPHEGRGVKDEATSVARHRDLLTRFFQSAVDLIVARRSLTSSLVHVTVKRGAPYDKWNVVELARSSVQPPLRLAKTYRFEPSQYEGYSHGLTRGDEPGENNHLADSLCVTYVFAVRDENVQEEIKMARKRKAKQEAKLDRARFVRPRGGGGGASASAWRKRHRT